MTVSSGLIITDGNYVLVELPYKRSHGDHSYDLPKGQMEIGESALDTAFREAKEETGYDWDKYKSRAVQLDEHLLEYTNDKQLILYKVLLKPEEMPKLSELHCRSYFVDQKSGYQVPEVVSFKLKPITELRRWLFKTYGKVIDKIEKRLITGAMP